MPEFRERPPLTDAALNGLFPVFEPEEEFEVRRLKELYTNNLPGLSRQLPVPEYTMDALIAPMARSAGHVIENAKVARTSGTELLVLVSHEADPHAVATLLSDMYVPNWVVAEMYDGFEFPGLKFNSQELIPDVSRRPSPSNLSLKRLFGYAVGRQVGWKKQAFVDDDIRLGSSWKDKGARTLYLLSQSLEVNEYAGPRCAGYPDKAVDDHARDRIVHHHASVRISDPSLLRAGNISGNSFAVNVEKARFFSPPENYNEDLIGTHDSYLQGKVAIVNDAYYQASFDPFKDPNRGKYETFGEFMYEGLYRAKGFNVDFSDSRYWDRVVASQNSQIAYMLKALDTPQDRGNFGYMTILPEYEEGEKEKIRASLETILDTGEQIKGRMCADYYTVMRDDEARWGKYVDNLPPARTVEDAIGRLGLTAYASHYDKRKPRYTYPPGYSDEES
jgi:hypothetical protein